MMNSVLRSFVCAAALLGSAGYALAVEESGEITIKDKQGRTLTGTIQSANQREVVFVTGGKPMTIQFPVLDPASKEEVLDRAKQAGLYDGFPKLKVQVMVGTKRRPGDTWYEKRMEIVPRAVVEAAAMDSIPAMEATMVIITMDTHAKYVQKVEKFSVQTRETREVPPADTGAKREIEFEPCFVDFDSYRDSTNVGGAVYKYYIFGLQDAETKKVLHFDTNCAELTKHVAATPDAKAKFLAIGNGAIFKTDF